MVCVALHSHTLPCRPSPRDGDSWSCASPLVVDLSSPPAALYAACRFHCHCRLWRRQQRLLRCLVHSSAGPFSHAAAWVGAPGLVALAKSGHITHTSLAIVNVRWPRGAYSSWWLLAEVRPAAGSLCVHLHSSNRCTHSLQDADARTAS